MPQFTTDETTAMLEDLQKFTPNFFGVHATFVYGVREEMLLGDLDTNNWIFGATVPDSFGEKIEAIRSARYEKAKPHVKNALPGIRSGQGQAVR